MRKIRLIAVSFKSSKGDICGALASDAITVDVRRPFQLSRGADAVRLSALSEKPLLIANL
jgi:hypothetical protein